MRGAKITVESGRRFAVVARSGSYAICWQALPAELQRIPDQRDGGQRWHPISACPTGGPLMADEPADGLCCMVRDPVERFRSACARQKKTVEEGLGSLEGDVHFWPLADMGLLQPGVTHFRFPDQINACADWLGLSTPVPQLNAEPEEGKPNLTPEQVAAVRQAYAYDIALWESLKKNK